MSSDLNEEEFRELIRGLLAQRRYPDHAAVRNAMGRRNEGHQLRSGLTTDQTRWRVEEVERAGFDWNASKSARRLVSRAG